VTVVADAGTWPDLGVLTEGMRAGWNELSAGGPKALARESTSALPV
jgi:hypothetical protein